MAASERAHSSRDILKTTKEQNVLLSYAFTFEKNLSRIYDAIGKCAKARVDCIQPLLKRIESLYNRKREAASLEALFEELPGYIDGVLQNARSLKLSVEAKEKLEDCRFSGQKRQLKRPKQKRDLLKKVVSLHEIFINLCNLKLWLENTKRETSSLIKRARMTGQVHGVVDYLMCRVFWNLKDMCLDYRMPLLRIEQQWDFISGSMGNGNPSDDFWGEILRRKHDNVDVYYFKHMRRRGAPHFIPEEYYDLPSETRLQICQCISHEEFKQNFPEIEVELSEFFAQLFDEQISWMPQQLRYVLLEIGISLSRFQSILTNLNVLHPAVENLISQQKRDISEYAAYEILYYIFGEPAFSYTQDLRENAEEHAEKVENVSIKIRNILDTTPSLTTEQFCKFHRLVRTFISCVPQDIIVEDCRHNLTQLEVFVKLFCNELELAVLEQGYCRVVYGKLDYLTQFGPNLALMTVPLMDGEELLDLEKLHLLKNDPQDKWLPYTTDITNYVIETEARANCQDGKVFDCTFFTNEDGEEDIELVVKIKEKDSVEKPSRRVSDDRPVNEKLIQQYLKMIPANRYVLPLHGFAKQKNKFYYFMEKGHYEVFDYVRDNFARYVNDWKAKLENSPMDYHKDNPSPWEQKMKRWYKMMVLAVKHLHDHKMVHRDLKLENFILMGDSEENYTPKMIDFGLGRHFPDANHSFATVNACGTPAYRPPEVFNHGNTTLLSDPQYADLDLSHYDGRKHDTWTMGICLYMMMFRRNPWSTPTNVDRKFRQLTSNRFMPRSRRNPSQNIRRFLERYQLLSLCTSECVDHIERIWVPEDRRPLCDKMLTHSFCTSVNVPPG